MQARRLPSQKTFVRFVNFVVRESDCDAHRSLYNYRMKKSLFVSILCVSLALGFGLRAQTKNANSQEQSAKKDENAKPIDSSNMDTSVKPSDDFFLYANGGWNKRTEIPPAQTRWASFNILIERNHNALHGIAEKVAKTKSTDPTTQKVSDYYASGMDEKTIDQMRTKPLQDELAKIEN